MTDQARGGPRRRINAPRNASEAHQLIAQLKTQFGIVDMEDQLQALLEAQQDRHTTQMDAWLRQVFGLAMSQTGLRSLMIRQDQLNDITGQPRVEFGAIGSKIIMVSIVTGG